MRNNQPITQREYKLNDQHLLITRTDLDGRITYANAAFVEVSGFEHAELIGANHNIIRHPDMPPEAFADLWQAIKRGDSWQGVVKNRRKNGDHYWVQATVTPIVEAASAWVTPRSARPWSPVRPRPRGGPMSACGRGVRASPFARGR